MTQTIRTSFSSPARKRGSSFQGPMRLAELVYGPWAIAPSTLTELQSVYETHLRGEKIDIAALEARLGRPLANEQRSYEMPLVPFMNSSGRIAESGNNTLTLALSLFRERGTS